MEYAVVLQTKIFVLTICTTNRNHWSKPWQWYLLL